ncbi:MAG: hypothetical protein QOI66_1837 [Myxococcales bacterium]|jgi:hypothetical protein|nr:hypothetical protein [Myxococcales bacterium]
MGRTLSLLALLPPSNDGELTAEERREAQQRGDEGKARAAAARALLRKKEGERLKRQEVVDVIDEQVRAADERLRALRALDEQLRQDQRLNELWRLRREGWSLGDAMDEIDRRFPGPPAIEGG